MKIMAVTAGTNLFVRERRQEVEWISRRISVQLVLLYLDLDALRFAQKSLDGPLQLSNN